MLCMNVYKFGVSSASMYVLCISLYYIRIRNEFGGYHPRFLNTSEQVSHLPSFNEFSRRMINLDLSDGTAES
jgi:hypothetical protein